MIFSFPVVNLGIWAERRDELEALAPVNPFAVFISAQIETNQHPDKATRLGPKLRMMRQLAGYGYQQDQVHQVFRLVDWLIRLPDDLEDTFERALRATSQEQKMTYVTSIERWGIKKGLAQGLEKGMEKGIQRGQAELLLRQVQRRFGPASDEIMQKIQAATEPQLELWALNILDARTLDDVFRD